MNHSSQLSPTASVHQRHSELHSERHGELHSELCRERSSRAAEPAAWPAAQLADTSMRWPSRSEASAIRLHVQRLEQLVAPRKSRGRPQPQTRLCISE
jgi:hypothetical protein